MSKLTTLQERVVVLRQQLADPSLRDKHDAKSKHLTDTLAEIAKIEAAADEAVAAAEAQHAESVNSNATEAQLSIADAVIRETRPIVADAVNSLGIDSAAEVQAAIDTPTRSEAELLEAAALAPAPEAQAPPVQSEAEAFANS